MKKPAERSPEAIIRDLRAEVKEEHDWRMRLSETVRTLEAQAKQAEATIDQMYTDLIGERNELMTRVGRIDVRIRALGFRAPGNQAK